ncbi:MAG TPA: patatin-like phospholipase family protein [bacterium]|jgi:predicted acylesterase/phospholipase RssA
MTLSKYLFLIFAAVLLSGTARAETVALALSGGGARGFAAIGVLQALEEEHLEPDLIVGTSIGAVLGGLYAAGYSATELRTIALNTEWNKIFLDRPSRRNLFLAQKETVSRHILSVRFRGWSLDVPTSLTSGQKLSELLFELVHRAPYQPWPSFDDLRIPFRAVATDLISGKPIVFKSGDLAEAMRASISMPLVFAPYRMDTLLMVDGGVAENIPVNTAREQGADVVVAVDMSATPATDENLTLPWELVGRVTTIMQSERRDASVSRADVVIAPDLDEHHSTDFSDIPILISAGYLAAKAQMPLLRTKFHRADSSAAACASSFCSRARYRDFKQTLNCNSLPPAGYVFTGVNHMPDSTINDLPPGKDGLKKLVWLRQAYLDVGRTLAHATRLDVTPDHKLSSHWEEGHIRQITVEGLHRHRESSLLREFPLTQGDVFNLRWAKRGLNQIYGSDLYESVNLAVQSSDSGAALKLRVVERPSPQLRFGAGYSLERRGRAFVEFLNDNTLDIGARLAVFGKYGEKDEEARLGLTFDRIPFSTPLDDFLQSYTTIDLRSGWSRSEFNLYRQHHSVGDYFFERSSAELWVGRAFRRWAEVSWGLRHESVLSGGMLSPSRDQTTYLGVRTLVDTQDSYPFPSSGLAFNGSYEYGLRSRSTDRFFNRVMARADGYIPLTKRLVVHGRGDYAWNDRIMPPWALFPLGGEGSLLGLHTAEYLGNVRTSLLGEVRYDLISRWMADAYLSATYTVGAVSAASDPLPRADEYQHGIGVSFSLSTLLGPMRFTASRLISTRLAPDQTVFYLNLGHEF